MTAVDLHKHGLTRLIGNENELRELATSFEKPEFETSPEFRVYFDVLAERTRAGDEVPEFTPSESFPSVSTELGVIGVYSYREREVVLFQRAGKITSSAAFSVETVEGVPIISGNPRPVIGDELELTTSAMTMLANRGYSEVA